MDDLIARFIAHILSIIDQLHADLDALPNDADTTAIKEAIQRLENALHKNEK